MLTGCGGILAHRLLLKDSAFYLEEKKSSIRMHCCRSRCVLHLSSIRTCCLIKKTATRSCRDLLFDDLLLFLPLLIMKTFRLFSFFLAVSCLLNLSYAQGNVFSTAVAHSHNDYNQDTAFYKAYHHGFGSIEADVFLVGKELYVAHDLKEVRPERTLQKLYLDPLKALLEKDKQRRIQLLIDIKEKGDSVLPVVVQQLAPLHSIYSTGRLRILISGNRPLPVNYSQYPGFIFFDDDLVHAHTKEQWARVGLVSLQFSLFSAWKGTGVIPEKEEDRLRRVINSVHAAGKSIRFWGAPDTVNSWKELVKLGVDIIGTDKVEELSRLLTKVEP